MCNDGTQRLVYPSMSQRMPRTAGHHQKLAEAGRSLPWSPWREPGPADHAFFSDLWPPTVRIKACCLKHPIGGALWWQPQDMITVGIQ